MEIEVAQRIPMLRKRCGLSIRQLAELSGVTAGMISCIERGKNSPSIATLQKITRPGHGSGHFLFREERAARRSGLPS